MTSSTTVSSPAESPPTEIRIDRTAKRIRVFFAGKLIGDSVSARLGYSTGRHPEYLIPVVEINWANVVVDDGELVESSLGSYSAIRTKVGGREICRRYTGGPAAGLASFDFDSMDLAIGFIGDVVRTRTLTHLVHRRQRICLTVAVAMQAVRGAQNARPLKP
jgi:hypothetical protein